MSVLEPLVNRKRAAGSGLAPKMALGARLLVAGTGWSEGRQKFVFEIVPSAVSVQGNRHLFSAGRVFNRPANVISFGPGGEFDGTAERLRYGQFKLSLRTGYCAVFRRLDSNHGAGDGAIVVTDDSSDGSFRTRSKQNAKCNGDGPHKDLHRIIDTSM